MERVLVTSLASKELQMHGLANSSGGRINSHHQASSSPYAATRLLPEAVHGLQNQLRTSRNHLRRPVQTRRHFAGKHMVVEGAVATEIEEIEGGSNVEEVEQALRQGNSLEDLKTQALSMTTLPLPEPEVGNRWREIQGQNDWKGLLNPLDLFLRLEILRYGDYCQTTYDAFDYDKNTKFCGSCRYAKKNLFKKVNLQHSGYEVTDYLYGTAGGGAPKSFFRFNNRDAVNDNALWDVETNWMGYVAVTTDPKEIKRLGRRDILIAWRGTIANVEWVNDMQSSMTDNTLDPRREGQSDDMDLKLEKGFLSLYTTSNKASPYMQFSARTQLLHAVRRLVAKYGNEELSITVTGHSLGAALAVISAYDIAESGLNQPQYLPNDNQIKEWNEMSQKDNPDDVVHWTQADDIKTIPVTAFTFAGPRVGNKAFKDRMDQLQVKVLRVLNKHDLVPKTPGVFINEKSTVTAIASQMNLHFMENMPGYYFHVGQEIVVDNDLSPFLKRTNSPGDYHNLEALLHVVSGYQEQGKPFNQVVPRDLALVNKSSNILQEKFFVPASWWQQEHRGIIRFKYQGVWVTLPRSREDVPEHFDLEKELADDAFLSYSHVLAGSE